MFWDGTRWVDETTPPPTSTPSRSQRLRDWAATITMVLVLAAIVLPFSSTSAATLPGVRLIRSWDEGYDVRTLQETNGDIVYRGNWASARHDAYLGDRVRYATARGASATTRFTGTAISWVGPTGPTRGKARIYLDGRAIKTVDTYSRSFRPTQVLYTVTLDTYSTHTFKVVTLGTSGHPMIAVDAFVVRGKKDRQTTSPSPTPKSTATPSATATPVATTGPTPSPTDNLLIQATASPTATVAPATASPTPAPTRSAAPTATIGPVPTPTPTPDPTPDPTPAVDGTVVPVGSLATAISNASSGDTLLLRGGEHRLSSMISTSKSLTIRNYPGETPVITHPTNRPDFLYLKGGPVVIRNITFKAQGGTFEDSMGSAASEVDGGHDVTYVNVTFIGDPDMGERQQLLYVRYGDRVTIRDCEFIANGTDGFGVHVYPGESADPQVIVENSTFTGFGVSAAITSSSRITVRGNTFRDSRLAIQLRANASSSSITDNTSSNTDQGIEVGSGVSNLTTSGNSWN